MVAAAYILVMQTYHEASRTSVAQIYRLPWGRGEESELCVIHRDNVLVILCLCKCVMTSYRLEGVAVAQW